MLIAPAESRVGIRRFSRDERLDFSRRRVGLPVLVFLGLVGLYAGLAVAALASPPWYGWVFSGLTGVAIGLLFIVGHDACHNSLTRSTRLNQVIGRLAFLPNLHSFSLWDLAHNRIHHRYNNVRGWDYVWAPMTPEEYADAPRTRRLFYRVCRTPAGVPLYYLVDLWARRLLLPFPAVVGRVTALLLLDSALVLLFLGVQLAAAVAIGGAFGKSALTSVALGVVGPFLVWNAFISFVIFLHHSHPAVAWYPSVAAWTAAQGALHGTVHVRFPWPIGPMLLAIMEHNAHHHAPGVPLYNLARMQREIGERGEFVAWAFSWRGFARICRRCKLYDYEAGRWVTFAPALPVGAGQP